MGKQNVLSLEEVLGLAEKIDRDLWARTFELRDKSKLTCLKAKVGDIIIIIDEHIKVSGHGVGDNYYDISVNYKNMNTSLVSYASINSAGIDDLFKTLEDDYFELGKRKIRDCYEALTGKSATK